jgi:hypothetical protein
MVATFNGWDDMPEVEREALEQWEREHEGLSSAWALPTQFVIVSPTSAGQPATTY